jgi:hypothetical protein
VVADITQQRTDEGWLYLAVVLDAFSRRIVGWSMAEHLRTEPVLDALDMAIAQRNPGPGLVHHSDHGCQPLVQVLAGPPPAFTSGNDDRRVHSWLGGACGGSRSLIWLPALVMGR